MTLPSCKQKGTGKRAVVFTTKVTAVRQVSEADFRPPFLMDYVLPASEQVTVPAEGGLILMMKIKGQGPFRTVFDTGAVNVVSTTFAKGLGLKVEERRCTSGRLEA